MLEHVGVGRVSDMVDTINAVVDAVNLLNAINKFSAENLQHHDFLQYNSVTDKWVNVSTFSPSSDFILKDGKKFYLNEAKTTFIVFAGGRIEFYINNTLAGFYSLEENRGLDNKDVVVALNTSVPNHRVDVRADILQIGAYNVRNIDSVISILETGANGRDAGTVTYNAWYAVFAIYNPNSRVSAGLLSRCGGNIPSTTNPPVLPLGYEAWRHVGWAYYYTDGTNDSFVSPVANMFSRTYRSSSAFDITQADMGSHGSFLSWNLSELTPPGTKEVDVLMRNDAAGTLEVKGFNTHADVPEGWLNNQTSRLQVRVPVSLSGGNRVIQYKRSAAYNCRLHISSYLL